MRLDPMATSPPQSGSSEERGSHITTVFFDLDGTLLDTRPGIISSILAALSENVPAPLPPESAFIIGPPIREIIRRALPGISPAALEASAKAFRHHYDTVGWQDSRPYAGVYEVLDELASLGIRRFVITNKPRTPTRLLLERAGIFEVFEAVLSPDALDPPFVSKQAIAEHCVTTFGADRATALFVGDSADDASAAQACGIPFVAAAYGYGQVNALSAGMVCYQIADIRELPALLFSEDKATRDADRRIGR